MKPVKIKLTWVILAAVVVVAVVVAARQTDEDYSEFARCLSEKGAVMYGTYWCSHCKAQKADFGDAFQYINYLECTEQNEACIEKGIEGFPTWIIDGRKYPGRQPLSRLSQLTGCELEVKE